MQYSRSHRGTMVSLDVLGGICRTCRRLVGVNGPQSNAIPIIRETTNVKVQSMCPRGGARDHADALWRRELRPCLAPVSGAERFMAEL